MSRNIHQNRKWLRLAEPISIDAAMMLAIITLAHLIRQATRNLLNEISSYSAFLAETQSLLSEQQTNPQVEQTLQTVYALTQKTLVLNYLLLPVGIAIIFSIAQAIIYHRRYGIPYKQCIKYTAIFISTGYLFVWASLNLAMGFVYEQPTSLLWWILSVGVLIITSYICMQKMLHPQKELKKISSKRLIGHHLLFLASSTILLTGATLIYFFLQTQQNLTIPLIITTIGIVTLYITRETYINKSRSNKEK